MLVTTEVYISCLVVVAIVALVVAAGAAIVALATLPQLAGGEGRLPRRVVLREHSAGCVPGRHRCDAMVYRKYSRMLPSHAAGPDVEKPVRSMVPGAGAHVTLHIYDVTRRADIQHANHILHVLGTGAYHVAVQVYGREWSYGFVDDGGSGVFPCDPGACELHSHRHTLDVGCTSLCELEVEQLLQQLSPEWLGEDYDVLRCNCCHFSRELCRRLGVDLPPRWVMNLADAGSKLEDGYHGAQDMAAKAHVSAKKALSLFSCFGSRSLRSSSKKSPLAAGW